MKDVTLPPKLATYLTPSLFQLTYATKGLIAMGAAVYISMLLDLDRPYWSMIAAIFLQIKPESGIVLEKSLFQLSGTLIGGVLGLVVLSFGVQAPPIILAVMAVVVFVMAFLAGMMHNSNATYFFCMAMVTMNLVVLLSMNASTITSESIFDVAVQRISEMCIGEICAALASLLLWPRRVYHAMFEHAHGVTERALGAVRLQLDEGVDRYQRYAAQLDIISAVVTLETDSEPARYESPLGLGRSRAAHLLSERALTLNAELSVLSTLMRDHVEWQDTHIDQLLERLNTTIERAQATGDIAARVAIFQDLRQQLREFDLQQLTLPIQYRVWTLLNNICRLMIVMLNAERGVVSFERVRLKAARVYRPFDMMTSLTIGTRALVMFALGSVGWIASGWDVGLLAMTMPLVWSIMFAATAASPAKRTRDAFCGALLATPVALIVNILLLPEAPSFYEVFFMVFGAPLFVGIMGLSNGETIGFSLGFCMNYIIMTEAGNHMSWNFVAVLERGMAISLSTMVLWFLFRLIKTPGALMMRKRLIGGITRDITALGVKARNDMESWFTGRMGFRIKQLAGYDSGHADDKRALIDQGLLGLNLGYSLMMHRHNVERIAGSERFEQPLYQWQWALAKAFQASAWGVDQRDHFSTRSHTLYQAYADSGLFDAQFLKQFQGICERMKLSLDYNARGIQQAA